LQERQSEKQVTANELINQCICEKLIDLTISGQKKKSAEMPVKIKIRPVVMKEEIQYQASEYIGTKSIS